MITYKKLIKQFEGKDIEQIQTFVNEIHYLGGNINKRLLHKMDKVLEYYCIKNTKARDRSIEARKPKSQYHRQVKSKTARKGKSELKKRGVNNENQKVRKNI